MRASADVLLGHSVRNQPRRKGKRAIDRAGEGRGLWTWASPRRISRKKGLSRFTRTPGAFDTCDVARHLQITTSSSRGVPSYIPLRPRPCPPTADSSLPTRCPISQLDPYSHDRSLLLQNTQRLRSCGHSNLQVFSVAAEPQRPNYVVR